MIKSRILKPLYIFFMEIILRFKGCKFENKVAFDDKCTFEGKNFIASGSYLRNVDMGLYSYLGYGCYLVGTKIGRYTSIGPGVKTVLGRHPVREFVSTYPLFFSKQTPIGDSFMDQDKYEQIKYADKKNQKYAIIIGNDVWVGADVTIVDGVTIGDGAIIGAKSLVLHDVEPYSVVVGSPAKEIKKRFSDDQIVDLLKFQWWNKDQNWIRKHVDEYDDPKKIIKALKDGC